MLYFMRGAKHLIRVEGVAVVIHSKKKVLQSTFFGASGCHKQRTLLSTWKDQIVPRRTMIGIFGSRWTPRFYHGPSRCYLVLPGTE